MQQIAAALGLKNDTQGRSYGLTYRFDGVNETFDANYENFSMNLTGITRADIRSIFSLNK